MDAAAVVLKSEFVQKCYNLDSATTKALHLSEWSSVKQGLVSQSDLVIIKEKYEEKLIITAPKDIMDGILEIITVFFRENTIHEKYVPFNKGITIIVSSHMKDALQKICEDFRSCMASVKEIMSLDKCGFIVSATEFGLSSVVRKVTDLTRQVYQQEKKVDMPGMSHYLRSARGRMMIDSIQTRNKAYIEEMDVARRSMLQAAKDEAGEMVVTEVQLDPSFVLKVILGNITDAKVDGIVNAANAQLDHIGGVAKSIVDKG